MRNVWFVCHAKLWFTRFFLFCKLTLYCHLKWRLIELFVFTNGQQNNLRQIIHSSWWPVFNRWWFSSNSIFTNNLQIITSSEPHKKINIIFTASIPAWRFNTTIGNRIIRQVLEFQQSVYGSIRTRWSRWSGLSKRDFKIWNDGHNWSNF